VDDGARLYNPPAMSLHEIDCLNIWEIAHRWEGVDPNEENPEGPPAKVRARLRDLTYAAAKGLRCYHVYGELVFIESRSFGGAVRRTRLASNWTKRYMIR
jgi:hypothetical protein